MDVIDQLLAELHQESCVFCRLELTAPWRIQKGASLAAPFYVVLSGTARIESASGAHDIGEGDFLVVPSGEPHEIMSAHGTNSAPITLYSLFGDNGVQPFQRGIRHRRTARVAYGGGGARSVILVGLFSFGDRRKNPLLSALPPVLVMRGATNANAARSRAMMVAIAEELAVEQPGSNLTIAKLVELLFMQAIRGFLATDVQKTAGWMRGITDPIVGRAISCMHAEPGKRWTVQALADEAGCSRAVFAQRFSSLVGQGALGYLTEWRMHVAAGMLLDRSGNIGTVAGRVGYGSDAAFSSAFKRWAGASPGQYRSKILAAESRA